MSFLEIDNSNRPAITYIENVGEVVHIPISKILSNGSRINLLQTTFSLCIPKDIYTRNTEDFNSDVICKENTSFKELVEVFNLNNLVDDSHNDVDDENHNDVDDDSYIREFYKRVLQELKQNEKRRRLRKKAMGRSYDKYFKGWYHHFPLTSKLNYKCDICGECFKDKYNLESHLSFHLKNQYRCEICSKTFTMKQGIYFHLKLNHVSKYQCEICEKEFLNKYSFKAHYYYHHKVEKLINEISNNYQCHYCKKDFPTKAAISLHLRFHELLKDTCLV